MSTLTTSNDQNTLARTFWNIFPSSFSHAVSLAGVARVFTSIDPYSAAVTGAIMPITAYALNKIFPTPNCCSVQDDNVVLKYAITRIGGYALSTLAANAMGFPITFAGTMLLCTGSNLLLLGALIITKVAANFFTTATQRYTIDTSYLQQMGHPFLAFLADSRDNPSAEPYFEGH